MDTPNLFMEDTDYNICLSWLCGSTDGQTYSISTHFGAKMKRPENMSEDDWHNKTAGIFHCDAWETAIGWKYDYKIDDPLAKEAALKMVEKLNNIIELANADPDWAHWNDAAVYVFECKIDGKEHFSFRYHGTRDNAARFAADLVIAELGDGDGENGGKGSLRNCIKEIADCLYYGGTYCYADCHFVFCREKGIF